MSNDNKKDHEHQNLNQDLNSDNTLQTEGNGHSKKTLGMIKPVKIETEQTKISKPFFKKHPKIFQVIKNPTYIILSLILIFTVYLRLKYFSMESIWNDAAIHLWYSYLAATNPISILFDPKYYLGDLAIPQTLTAIFYVFSKNLFLSGKLMALTYSLLGVFLVYLLGKKIHSKQTGLISAALLATNHIFYFYGTRPLGDAPLTTSIILFFYCLLRLEEKAKEKIEDKKIKSFKEWIKKYFWSIATPVSLMICMLHKTQAAAFALGFLVYIFLFYRKKAITNKHILISWLSITVSSILAHLIAYFFFSKNLFGRLFGLMGDFRGMPYGFEALSHVQWISTWYLLIFTILGILLMFTYKHKRLYPLLFINFMYYLYFEINIDQTMDRYILPILPMIIIFAAFSIEEISAIVAKYSHKYVKNILIVIIAGIICFQFLSIATPLIDSKASSYIGHSEAGEFLIENMGEEDIIFAGSQRLVRLFTLKEYYEEDGKVLGGPVYSLRDNKYKEISEDENESETLTLGQKNFEQDLLELNQNHTVWVEIDIWEYVQPDWYYPLTQESLDYFSSLGFTLEYVVVRELQTGDTTQNIGVIYLMKKEKIDSTSITNLSEE